jgi:hypothetical protein
LINTQFQRLANYKAIINGKCLFCKSNLFIGKVIPKPGVNKKYIKMKKKLVARKNNYIKNKNN